MVSIFPYQAKMNTSISLRTILFFYKFNPESFAHLLLNKTSQKVSLRTLTSSRSELLYGKSLDLQEPRRCLALPTEVYTYTRLDFLGINASVLMFESVFKKNQKQKLIMS